MQLKLHLMYEGILMAINFMDNQFCDIFIFEMDLFLDYW
jgi:hypothetical protein